MIVSTGLDRTMKIFDPEHESGNRNMGKCVLFHKSDKREHQVNIVFLLNSLSLMKLKKINKNCLLNSIKNCTK